MFFRILAYRRDAQSNQPARKVRQTRFECKSTPALITLELCALLNFPLNYANIIALPVLLGVGVAFKIYYVMAWRSGQSDFLQSPLTRAVLFSALMTATAFGSLSISSHPGTASMGKLLALSLACTLASAALFQPALMGEPRRPDEKCVVHADC